jgi:Zn-finger protein
MSQVHPKVGEMQNCETCFGKKWFAHIDTRTGLQRVHKDGRRIWRCWRCGNVQEEKAVPILPAVYRSSANILYLDIETSKSLVFNYGLSVPSKYISPDNLVHEYYIICWTASYLGRSETFGDCVTSKEAKDWTDKRILKQIRDLMASADILAGHNIDGFDIKRLNTRFLLNGLEPVTGKKTLDTLKIARSRFKFESNKLDYISTRLGFRPKDHIDNNDWLDIVKTGNEKTLKKVFKYNKGDVVQGKNILRDLMKYSGKQEYYGSVTLA